MRSLDGVKPQDILILLKIISLGEKPWRGLDLAEGLGISPAEISMALERCQRSRLLDFSKKRVMKSALLEFLVHGLKYVFPASPGAMTSGIPTAHSAPPLAKKIISSKDVYVWPFAEGSVRGQTIKPLYETAPAAAQKDPKLYELLALTDALRVGRARERLLASKELEKRMGQTQPA